MKKLLAMCLSFCMLTFVGCNKDDSTKSESVSASQTTTTQTEDVSQPTEEEVDTHPLAEYRVNKDSNMFNLSLLPELQGEEIIRASLIDENTAIVIAGKSGEKLLTVDVTNGEVTEVAKIHENSGECYYGLICSLNPLVIYLSIEEGSYYYFFDEDLKPIDNKGFYDESLSSVSYAYGKDGKLCYFDETNSQIMELDLATFEKKDIYTLPGYYGYAGLEGFDESGELAVFAATSMLDDEVVTMLVDLESGEVNKVYKGEAAKNLTDFPTISCEPATSYGGESSLLNDEDAGLWKITVNTLGASYSEEIDFREIFGDKLQVTAVNALGATVTADSDKVVYTIDNIDESCLMLLEFEKAEKEEVNIADFEEYEVTEITDEQLEKLANEISEKYGIDVIYDERVLDVDFTNYKVSQENNYYYILNTLETLKQTLALYPDDFFVQMQQSRGCNDLNVNIVKAFANVDGSDGVSAPDGVARTDENGKSNVALRADVISTSTIVHEFSHILDYMLQEEWIFLEHEWYVNNPEDFAYYESYTDENGEEIFLTGDSKYTGESDEYMIDSDVTNVYFIDRYATTFATEDMARIMEIMITAPDEPLSDFYKSEHIIAKIEFYIDKMNQYFDKSEWGETTWEKNLNRALEEYHSDAA